jgi:flagellar basal-body rod modification protein FlgD
MKERTVAIDPLNNTEPVAPVIVPEGTRADSLGQDTFLKLLVTQLQNQDPTHPQDNAAFITQLATFSQLEQLTKISQAVTSMAKFFESTTAPAA